MSHRPELREGDLLSIRQVQRLMPVGRTTLYALVQSGQLPHHRIQVHGSRRARILIAREDVEAFLAATRQVRAPQTGRLDVDQIVAKVRRRTRPNGESHA